MSCWVKTKGPLFYSYWLLAVSCPYRWIRIFLAKICPRRLLQQIKSPNLIWILCYTKQVQEIHPTNNNCKKWDSSCQTVHINHRLKQCLLVAQHTNCIQTKHPMAALLIWINDTLAFAWTRYSNKSYFQLQLLIPTYRLMYNLRISIHISEVSKYRMIGYDCMILYGMIRIATSYDFSILALAGCRRFEPVIFTKLGFVQGSSLQIEACWWESKGDIGFIEWTHRQPQLAITFTVHCCLCCLHPSLSLLSVIFFIATIMCPHPHCSL